MGATIFTVEMANAYSERMNELSSQEPKDLAWKYNVICYKGKWMVEIYDEKGEFVNFV